MDDIQSTKLWIEKSEKSSTQKSPPNKKYKYVTLEFNELTHFFIKSFCGRSPQKWNLLAHAAWGLLLNHYSGSESMSYISYEEKNTKKSLAKKYLVVRSEFIESTSIAQYIENIETQLDAKNSLSENELSLPYGLIINNHKMTNDNEHINLCACIDKKNPALIKIQYNNNLYTEINILGLARHFETIIKQLCHNPEHTLREINLLTEEESKQILKDWSHPPIPNDYPKPNTCLHEMTRAIAKKYPQKIAVQHGDIAINYQHLDNASDFLANQLMTAGVKNGDLVCVIIERSSTLLITMLAIMKAGAVYVPINSKYPNDRIEFVFEDANPKIILASELTRIPETLHHKTLLVEKNISNVLEDELTISNRVDIESNAYIIYTSGTTGKPKGVIIKHKSLTNLILWYQHLFQINDEDHASQFASQGFDTFFCEVVPFLAVGATVHIVDDHTKLTPSLFFDWLVSEEITVCDLPTAYAQVLFGMPWPLDNHLRVVKIGGESINQYPNKDYNFDIWNTYGPSEATVETTYIKIYSADPKHPIKAKSSSPPIGRPLINSEIYIVNKYMQLVPQGIAGEILIGGINISPGYLNRSDLTAEKFIDNPFHLYTSSKVYRTGDLAKWLPDGNIEFIGRIDNQVKIRGYRIELSEIERVILEHPDVSDAVVTVKENANNQKILAAYVIPNLDKERYVYQESCLIHTEDHQKIEGFTEDISKEGICINGLQDTLQAGSSVILSMKWPGMNDQINLTGHIVWSDAKRCGVALDLHEMEIKTISKSIDFYLASQNIMDVLRLSSNKRSLKRSLKRTLPEYMVPSIFVTLLHLPLTFSGKVDLKSLPVPKETEHPIHEYIPPSTATEKLLSDIWMTLLGKSKISMADNFFESGGTSISAAQLTIQTLQTFGISIPAQLIFDLPYIPILAEYIETNGKNYRTNTMVQKDILQDSKLSEDIYPTNHLSPTIMNAENILLTGAGGFLGIYFLRHLLNHTNAKIYCLIRKGEFESAAERLISTISKFNLANDISLANRRIIIISSDLSMQHFGLPENQYNALVSKIELIIHCGAQVNTMASYHKLRSSNVLGTLEVIRFATTKVDKPIHYISTLSSAYLKNKDGYLVEEFPTQKFENFYGGYAITKWVSECLLTEIKNRGLPVAIYRSGYIAGQSDTGITSLNDSLLLLIKGCIQLGYAPDMQEKITILPVDFVSEAISELALHFPTESNVYHIDHPTGILWLDLVAWINSYGYPVKVISMNEWKDKLITLTNENALFPFIPHYLSQGEDTHSPNVSVAKATNQLNKCNLTYPPINDELLNIYFDYLCQVEFLAMPGTTKSAEIKDHTEVSTDNVK